MAGFLGTGFAYNKGQQTSGPSGLSARVAQQLQGMFGQLGPEAQEALMGILQGDVNEQLAPYLAQLRGEATQGFREGVLPEVNKAAQQSGNFFSLGRQNAMNQASQRFGQGLGSALAAPTFGAFENAQNRQLQGAGMGFNLGQMLTSLYTKGKSSGMGVNVSGGIK